ncbi:hypothetical protein ACROYT_G007723 [Oculina patagonica]
MEDASKESQIYGDIVQADYHEHFWNMSYKVAMGFEWSVKYCTFHYLLKADDDVFVNTLGLMDFLTKYTTPRRKFYTGNIMIGSVVLRDGRYGVSPEEYNETIYKPYCSGGGYVLSRDVVEKLLSYFDVLKPLKIDDAYIGILANRAGVNVTHNEDFRMFENNCEYKETTLVQHPARGDCAIKLYHNMIGSVTDTHSYLHKQSSHPRHCKDGLPRGQLLRLRRLCSDDSDFLEKGKEMISFFVQRGYCASSLQRDLDAIQRVNRCDVIKHQDSESRDLSRIPLVLTFHPLSERIKRILVSNFSILSGDPQTKEIFPQPPLVAYHRDRNVRDTLVHTADRTNLALTWESNLSLHSQPLSHLRLHFS